jgi:hypothetical protein
MCRMSEEKSLDSIFNTKYTEFCDDLLGAYPEREGQIRQARALTEEERIQRFRTEVLPNAGRPTRDPLVNPGTVLPGVTIENPHWETFSGNTKKAIQEYITLLSFTCMFHDPSNPFADLSGNPAAKVWMDEMMNQWKSKLSSMDFKALSEKIMNVFGSSEGGVPKFNIPESFLKGQLAKLAEELVREFKPEDFGFSPEQLHQMESNPSRAFELLMNVYTQRPEILQNAMKRIAKRLQEKIQRGELRPQQIAAEAEEMMKQFTDNPAFVDLMESFRSTFGFEDPDLARSSGHDGDGRRAIVQQRLRAERDRREARRQAEQAQRQNTNTNLPSVDDLMRTMGLDKPDKKGKGGKGGRK